MAFPTVEAISTAAFNANVSAPAVPYPTPAGGILADDILLLLWSEDGTGSSVTDWGGFTELGQGAAGPAAHGVAWMRAAGGETGTVTLATAAPAGAAPVPPGSERQTAIMYCIRGAHTTDAPEASTAATGTSASADAPSLSPSWGAEDTLWIVTEGNDAEVVGTAAPTNYTDLTTIACTTSGAATSTARRELNAATEDPGAMTMSASETWRAYTVAIRPAGAAGPTPVSATRALAYERANAVSAERGLAYQRKNVVSAVRGLAYGRLASVAASVALAYGRVADVAATRALRYQRQGPAAATRELVYERVASVSSTRALGYVRLNAASATRALRYARVGGVAAARTLRYERTSTTTSTRALSYQRVATVSSTRALTYGRSAMIARSRRLVYVRGEATASVPEVVAKKNIDQRAFGITPIGRRR